MQESLAPEHSGELLADALEQLLDGSTVADEGRGHLQTTRRDVTDSGLDIIGDPFHKVGTVLVLDVKHLFIDFFHGHTATEHGCHGQVASMPWVTGSHHVLGIKHLLSEFWYCQGAVLLGSSAGEWGKTRHEEVKTRERHHVHCQFPEIGIQLKKTMTQLLIHFRENRI